MDNIFQEDLNNIIKDQNIDYLKFFGSTFLVTGATGLIGSWVVRTILKLNDEQDANIKIVVLVRNGQKAKSLFGNRNDINIIESDIRNKVNYDGAIDYIIHAASPTSSKDFGNHPVEVSEIIIDGAKNILELSKEKKVKDLIFLSTMEVYGRPETDEKIPETHATNLMTNESRNCYPIAKRMSENMCANYAEEYGVKVKILRLTQTFGLGVEYDDGRVFAEFARCVLENRDIVLHTKGETKRSYLYVCDAVRAIFTVIQKGVDKEIYNVANEETYCSVYEMAQLVASLNRKINVKIELDDISKYGYAPTLRINLDTEKICSIGWCPMSGLKEMYINMIKGFNK